jgi:Protein of unknown function (DUF3095)
MKAALVPVACVRAHGVDVRVARFSPSPNVTYAMFSGGGLEWADGTMRRGGFAVVPALLMLMSSYGPSVTVPFTMSPLVY